MNTRGHKRFEDLPGFPYTQIVFEIDRPSIVKKNHLAFLEFWDVDRIAKTGRLPKMFGKVVFFVSGYDHDERGLFEIPEARKYLRELAAVWPYFFYADALENGFLRDLLKCMVPSLTVAATSDNPAYCRTAIKTEDLNRAYRQLLDGLVRICPMDSGMNQEKFDGRVEAVQAHIQAELSG